MRTRASIFIIGPTLLGLALSTSGIAHAHFTLMSPPAADTSTGGGKGAPPCGPLTPASNIVTKVQGGHPLTVSVMETVPHPGFYRIALSMNSRTELPVDNVVYDSANKVLSPTGTPPGVSAKADFQATPVFPVLADNLWPHQGTAVMSFTTSLMLPNVTCAKCTLQVIEFMAQHGPNPGGAYFYHHCADLEITADPALPGPDAGVTDARPDVAGNPTGGTTGGNTGGAGGGSIGGSTGTGGGAGGEIMASTGGAVGTGGASTGGASTSGGANGTGGAATTGSSSGGHIGTGGAAPAVSGGSSSSGGCMIASRGIGNATGSLALVGLGLLFLARRRRR